MALKELFYGLSRYELERRLSSCWSAQQRAELIGDERSVDAMREAIDDLLDELLRGRP
jgi:hypothetical protein